MHVGGSGIVRVPLTDFTSTRLSSPVLTRCRPYVMRTSAPSKSAVDDTFLKVIVRRNRDGSLKLLYKNRQIAWRESSERPRKVKPAVKERRLDHARGRRGRRGRRPSGADSRGFGILRHHAWPPFN